MDWLKENWHKIITVITLLLLLIVLFQTCNRQEYRPIIYNAGIDTIQPKQDSAHKSQIIIEQQPKFIQQKSFYETNNFYNLSNDSLKSDRIRILTRDLLSK